MLGCIDVDYRTDHAMAACVLFKDWKDAEPFAEVTARVESVQPYVPGQFYKRELPCIHAVLAKIAEPLELIVVDGYVWLDGNGHPGLGAYLYESLGRSRPVVGVAKKHFATASAERLLRGASMTPLYVTAAGIDANRAADHVRSMHGPYRIPTLLGRVDALCRKA